MEDTKPGQVITPNVPSSPPRPAVGVPVPDRPGETGGTIPQPEVEPTASQSTSPLYAVAESQSQTPMVSQVPMEPAQLYYTPMDAQTQSDWQYNQDVTSPSVSTAQDVGALSWTAAEFVDHHKNVGWYAGLAGVTCVIALIAYVLTHDTFSTGVVVFISILFGVYAGRQPRMQQYGLDDTGLHVGLKTYNFHEFKTFSITQEGAVSGIVFMPLKRFMSPLTIYVLPETVDQIVSVLSQYLPFEQRKKDVVDSFLSRIRF